MKSVGKRLTFVVFAVSVERNSQWIFVELARKLSGKVAVHDADDGRLSGRIGLTRDVDREWRVHE